MRNKLTRLFDRAFGSGNFHNVFDDQWSDYAFCRIVDPLDRSYDRLLVQVRHAYRDYDDVDVAEAIMREAAGEYNEGRRIWTRRLDEKKGFEEGRKADDGR